MKTKNRKIILLSEYVVCGKKKSRFIKEQEAEGFSTLGKIIFPPLSLTDVIRRLQRQKEPATILNKYEQNNKQVFINWK